MRRTSGDIDFIINRESNEVVGLNLSSDYCAEHERGIEGLKNSFGIYGYNNFNHIDGIIDGVLNHGENLDSDLINDIFNKDFKMTKEGGHAYVISDGMDLVFTFDMNFDSTGLKEKQKANGVQYYTGKMPKKVNLYTTPKQNSSYVENNKRHYITPGKTKESIAEFIEKTHGFQAAWGERDFLIRARGENEKKILEKIIEAYKNNDLTFNIKKSSNPFSKGGLTLTKASDITFDIKKDYVLKLFESREINNALEKTNIVKTLKDKGFRVWGIMAEWFDKNDKEDMLYFFNVSPPRNICDGQQIHGWATLKDLMELSEGKGYFATLDKIDVYIGKAKERLMEEKTIKPSLKM